MRELPPVIQQVDRTYALFRGRKYSYFGGCDYFRLASHPKVLQAVREGVRKYGLNVSASRATTGNHALYERLEKELSGHFEAEAALLVSSGYLTNLVVAQGLAGEFSHALIDQRAHVCLADAAKVLGCSVVPFRHRDPADLARIARRLGARSRPILLTDGMFAHDGSVAPQRAYRRVLPRNGWMLVDDAHGAGVLGRTGRGSVELEGVDRRQLIQTITLSKAFGGYGGAVLCPRTVREKILARSRLFVGNTPLPLPLANAALAALGLLRQDRRLRWRLGENVADCKRRLRLGGLLLPDHPGPIICIVPRTHREAAALSRRLLKSGILPPWTQYPGGPNEGYFRFTVSSEHTRGQLDVLVETLIDHYAAAGRRDGG
jgi:7-keto-8-aminopelargonate synthetase-like enzyme